MKREIQINYNLFPLKIYSNQCNFFFFLNEKKIIIAELEDEKVNLERIIKLSNSFFYSGMAISTIIMNKENKYYFTYHNKKYVLLLDNSTDNDLRVIEDIIDINVSLDAEVERLNIIKTQDNWKSRVDKIEEKMLEFNKEYGYIQEVMNYYIGLAENAIQLLNHVNCDDKYLVRNLECKKYTNFNISNPMNFICGNKMNDLSNYLKKKFFYDKEDINEYLIKARKTLNVDDYVLLFANLLFPNYFFDEVDNSILNELEQKSVECERIIDQRAEYEKILCIFNKENNYIDKFLYIDWLI